MIPSSYARPEAEGGCLHVIIVGYANLVALLQVPPVFACAYFYQQRHRQRVDLLHLIPHQGAHAIHFIFGNFENQFVVNLQGHARLQALLAESGVDADHGNLDQIGGGALQWRVHRGALGEAAQVGVLAVDVGDGAHATEQRPDFLFAASLVQGSVDEGTHAFVFFK